MISEIKERSGCKKKIHFEVERERFEDEVKTTLRTVKKDIIIPGFRRGKAPDGMILRRFRATVHEETIKDLIPKVMKEAFDEKGIRPVGDPELSDLVFEETGPITFNVTVEEIPEIDIDGFKGISATKEIVKVEDEDVDASLERLRRMRSVQNQVEREVREGDIIVVNLQKLDAGGLPIIGEKLENHVISLDGHGTPSPDFDRQIVGMKAGESRTVRFTYDDTIDNPDLVGKSEAYDIDLLKVYENIVPDLTDEFAVGLGGYTGLEDLKEKTRARLERQNEYFAEQKLRYTLIDEFVRQNPFEVPGTMSEKIIESDIDRVRKQHPDEQIDEEALRGRFRPDAVRSVQTYIIIEEIKKKEKLDATKDEVAAKIEEIAAERGDNPKELRRTYIKEGRLDDVKNEILQDKAFSWIKSVASIREEKIDRPSAVSNIIQP